MRLFRVIVPVAAIERAARFYEELFGRQGRRVSPGRHYLDADGVIVALYHASADGDDAAFRANPQHLYLAVRDLEAVCARAQTLGGLLPETGDGGLPMGQIARRPWGERSFYMADPFGNPLCFVDDTTLFTGS